jgi:hypothetical protein
MNPRQFLLSLVLGTVFWFLAALFVRYFGAYFFAGPTLRLLGLYAASVPLSWVLIQLTQGLGRFSPLPLYDSVVVMTGLATLLDGIGLTFGRPLYGDSPTIVLLGAAWILWGAGCGLGLAYAMKTSWQRSAASRAPTLAAA